MSVLIIHHPNLAFEAKHSKQAKAAAKAFKEAHHGKTKVNFHNPSDARAFSKTLPNKSGELAKDDFNGLGSHNLDSIRGTLIGTPQNKTKMPIRDLKEFSPGMFENPNHPTVKSLFAMTMVRPPSL